MADYRVLVTGFGRFLKHGENSSERVLGRLPRLVPAGVKLETCLLPVEFERGWGGVREALERGGAPDALVLLGMAARTRRIRLERLAVNLADCESFAPRGRRAVLRPDNGGATPVDREIVPGGPLALPARADVKGLARALKARGLPVEVSLSAGSYVCNDVYYRALTHLRESRTACVFVHLPELPREEPVRVLGVHVPFLMRRTSDALSLGVQARTVAALIAELARTR